MGGLADLAQVSQQRISELEAGAITVRPPTAKALADALNVDIDEITLTGAPEAVA